MYINGHSLNARNKEEYETKRKPNLKSYSDVNDESFSWPKNDFLRYFQEHARGFHEQY